MGRKAKFIPAALGRDHLQGMRSEILADPESNLGVLIGESNGSEQTFAFAHPMFKGFYCPACEKGPFRISSLAVHYGKRNLNYQCAAMEAFLNNQLETTDQTLSVKKSTPTKVSIHSAFALTSTGTNYISLSSSGKTLCSIDRGK